MAHFAEIDENNIVQRVIVVNNSELMDENNQESEAKGREFCESLFGGNWIQTSYNNKIRNKYAAIGDTYSHELDVFIACAPYPSWILDGTRWVSPVPRPQDSYDYIWQEESLSWKRV